jgi:hypothetical protein
MSTQTVRIAYLGALAHAALRGCSSDQIREFGESYVGAVARLSDVRDWPTVSGAFAEWARDSAFASFAA